MYNSTILRQMNTCHHDISGNQALLCRRDPGHLILRSVKTRFGAPDMQDRLKVRTELVNTSIDAWYDIIHIHAIQCSAYNTCTILVDGNQFMMIQALVTEAASQIDEEKKAAKGQYCMYVSIIILMYVRMHKCACVHATTAMIGMIEATGSLISSYGGIIWFMALVFPYAMNLVSVL